MVQIIVQYDFFSFRVFFIFGMFSLFSSVIDIYYPIDICNAEAAPEEFYDSPALGSPRAAPPQSKPSPVHVPEDIGVGSLVEVATDVDQHYYGVVRWIGVIDGK